MSAWFLWGRAVKCGARWGKLIHLAAVVASSVLTRSGSDTDGIYSFSLMSMILAVRGQPKISLTAWFCTLSS